MSVGNLPASEWSNLAGQDSRAPAFTDDTRDNKSHPGRKPVRGRTVAASTSPADHAGADSAVSPA